MNNEEKKKVMDERARQKANLAKSMKEVVDPEIKVRFQNIEDPPTPGRPSPPFSFTFQTPKGLILTFKESRSAEVNDTALRHGEVYTLPLSVVNHINSLKTPVYAQERRIDNNTGAILIINKIVSHRNRFSCVPEDMTQFLKVDSDGDKGKAKAKRQKKNEEKQNEADETNKELAKLGIEA
jgi:hypothetical protein